MGRKDPVNLYYNFVLTLSKQCGGWVGGDEAGTLVLVEPTLKYHPLFTWSLTSKEGHCVVGSLTGVVASKRVTEAFKGTLSTLGNRA